MPEAVASDYGGVVCTCDSGILLPVVRRRSKSKTERVGWRCENCGAGYTNGFGRDSSLDKKDGRRRVYR